MGRGTMLAVAALAVALVAAAGCGGDDDTPDEVAEATTALTDTGAAMDTLEDALPDGLTLQLEEQNDSGITGKVELSPTSEGTLEVEIELDGSDGGPHPAHIHEGTCDDLNPTPAFPLEDVVDGESHTELDVSVDDVVATEYAVNVHESAENADVYVACADIRNL